MKNKLTISTWHLHLTGQVQGIGFRPTVYRIAQDFGIVGQIKNEADGLHIMFTTTEEMAVKFKREICNESLPPLARVTGILFEKIPFQKFVNFKIIHGNDQSNPNMVLTPDVAICEVCKQELSDKRSRRNNYAFNSCSQCGPRYSIIEKLPYDRINTKMEVFGLCKSCLEEYHNPSDRRYYAQTISCPNCAVQLNLYKSDADLISSDPNEIIDQVVSLWRHGNIIAIKGIGGFLLTCHAENVEVIQRLRKLKHRPTKPLAVMYPSLRLLDAYKVSKKVADLLNHHISPIVLIPKVEHVSAVYGICDKQDHLGVMLPNAPIFKVLLNKFQCPIVATSGNRSNSPIVYKNEDAFEQLSEIADYILTNNRDIVVPQDDSVLKYSEVHNQKIVLRRSRGLAPAYINPELDLTVASVLATGAQFKSTFSLHDAPNTYISQNIGDLDSFETIGNYKHCLEHLLALLKIEPTCILSDLHPEYASTLYGHQLAKKWNIPIHLIPHHKAHCCAILGEHNLIDSKEPVLGVIWDGAGLGDDDAIWGSEFFVYQNFEISRCSHLTYYDLVLGDKMAKEPRLSALSLAFGSPDSHKFLEQKFTTTEWKIYTQKLKNDNHIQTSSMGRLFDGVASILGLNDKQSFEGEAPMMLEVLARSFFSKHGFESSFNHYFIHKGFDNNLPVRKLIGLILEDLKNGVEKKLIAAKFHYTLIKWIEKTAQKQACKKIAFSGGVFQNSLLIDLAIEHLTSDYNLYFHEALSPNDENISFGQLIYHQIANKLTEND